MQIIKYGRIKAKKLTCSTCGAELSYTPKDIKHKELYLGDFPYINCPVCGRHNKAEPFKRPKSLTDKMED